MHIKKIKITKIEITKYDYKTQQAKIEIHFENETPLTFQFQLQKNHQQIAHKLIQEIKEKKKEHIIDLEDDILGDISLTHLQNDEEQLYEHIFKGLLKIESKVKVLLMNPKSQAYMDTLYALKNIKETLYRK